jgi:ferredoxin
MKIAICYYSATGNTLLACRYIGKRLSAEGIDFIDVAKKGVFTSAGYDAVGLAVPTRYFGMPQVFMEFLESLPPQGGKPAFVLNTYGMMPGRTLRILAGRAGAAGFFVFAGHSLHMPESYPPFIIKGFGFPDAPDAAEMAGLDGFAADVGEKLRAVSAGRPIQKLRTSIGLLNRIMPGATPAKARKEMGVLGVDESLCRGCGLCGDSCASGAVRFSSKPEFIAERCTACWVCYNRCPQKAIFTSRIKGTGHYPGPGAALAEKLGIGEKR